MEHQWALILYSQRQMQTRDYKGHILNVVGSEEVRSVWLEKGDQVVQWLIGDGWIMNAAPTVPVFGFYHFSWMKA